MTASTWYLQSTNLWRVVWKLLHLRILILTRSFRRSKTRHKIGMIVLGVFLAGILGFVFFLSWSLLRFLRSPELAELAVDLEPLVESMPVLILSGAFIGILFTSFGVLLQALYLAGDMDFLLSAPIPIRAVFIAKLLQAVLPNLGLVFLFALPVLFGLGASAGYSVLYYPAVVVLIAALALAAAGLASLLVMAVARIFPARRVAELLGFLGGVLSLVCSQSGQLANWAEFSPNQTQQALEAVERLDTPLSPLAWAGHGLIRIGEADWLAGLGITSLVLLGCGLIFAGALVTAEKLYYSGWASLHTVGRRKKASKRQMSQPKAKSGNALIQRWAAIPVWRIVEKDFSLLRRDVRNMSQLVTPLIIGIIYFVMLLRGGNEMASAADELPTLAGELFRSIRTYSNAGLALFVGWMLLSRLAGMGFSQEGRYYWLLKSAPVSIPQMITAKFLVAFLPVTALCWTFLLVTWLVQGQSTGTLLYTLPVVALAVAGNAGINLCFGILGANMNWEDPRQMQRGVSGCLGALATMIYLPLSLILFFGPAVVAVAFRLPEGAGQIAGLLIGSTFSLACATIPLWLVRKRVERLGEA